MSRDSQGGGKSFASAFPKCRTEMVVEPNAVLGELRQASLCNFAAPVQSERVGGTPNSLGLSTVPQFKKWLTGWLRREKKPPDASDVAVRRVAIPNAESSKEVTYLGNQAALRVCAAPPRELP